MSRPIAVSLLWAGIVFFADGAAAQTPAADALLAKADNLVKESKYDGALAAATEALRSVELAFGASDPRLVKALKEVARIYGLMERNGEAEAAYRRALALVEWLPAKDQNEIADLKNRLAYVAAKSSHAQDKAESAGASRDGAGVSGSWSGGGSSSGSSASREEGTRRGFVKKELTAPPAPAPAAPPASLSAASPGPVPSIPQFPWPPPPPSTDYTFPKDVFRRYSTVGEVTDTILTALERSGYVERSFYQTGDGGVALVTRLEMITNDGSPAADAERWQGYDYNPASFADFVRGLFYVKAGRYRVIVFILQEASFRTSGSKATAEDAEKWLTQGLIKLPPQLASKPFGKDSTCTALIYEYTSVGTAAKPVPVERSSLTGKQHLIKAGLLAVIEKPN
jgi:hypothetical protein